MKNLLFNIFLCTVLAATLNSTSINAQQVKINPFPIQSSTLIDDLKTVKKANPKITSEDFLKTANAMLDKQGLNYTFSFDAPFCQKLEQLKNAQKDKTAPFNLRGTLNAVEGEPAHLNLPVVQFDKRDCGICYIQMPILEITGESFITIIQKTNIKFYLPQNFIVNEATLLDGKNMPTVLTRWRIPFRAAPISVSDDGKILYLGFPSVELENLALMIFEEGVFQFCLKTDIDSAKKAELLKDLPKYSVPPNSSLASFIKGNTKQIIKFNSECEN